MRRRWLRVLSLAALPSLATAQRVSPAGAKRAASPASQHDGSLPAICRSATLGRLAAECERDEGYQPRRGVEVPQPTRDNSAWSIAASVLLPGAGQAMLSVDRWVPYMAFETYSWAQYATHSGQSRAHRGEYRRLAATVARSAFTIVFPAGNFDYYERMEHFVESGVFEVVAGGVLDPEPDTLTYNGSVWLLARRTYWADIDSPPDTASREWKLAADFYLRRAYDQPYRWSWRSAPFEYDEYHRLIRRSNDSNRKSLQDLGAIIANHLLSTVDAYITVRIRRRPQTAQGGWQVGAEVPFSSLMRP